MSRQHQAEVQIRFKDRGVGGDGFAIRRNRVGIAIQGGVNETKIEPGAVVLGFLLDGLVKGLFRGGIVLAVDGGLAARDGSGGASSTGTR